MFGYKCLVINVVINQIISKHKQKMNLTLMVKCSIILTMFAIGQKMRFYLNLKLLGKMFVKEAEMIIERILSKIIYCIYL